MLKVTTSAGVDFHPRTQLDTPSAWRYFRDGGILGDVSSPTRLGAGPFA